MLFIKSIFNSLRRGAIYNHEYAKYYWDNNTHTEKAANKFRNGWYLSQVFNYYNIFSYQDNRLCQITKFGFPALGKQNAVNKHRYWCNYYVTLGTLVCCVNNRFYIVFFNIHGICGILILLVGGFLYGYLKYYLNWFNYPVIIQVWINTQKRMAARVRPIKLSWNMV